jgi:fucose permease
MILFSPIEQKVKNEQAESKALHDFISMLKLAYKPLVLIFVISIFLYVLIEQGIGTWLPTFNRELLGLSLEVSVQMSSIFALGLAMGRLTAGQLLKRINWFPLLLACLTAMALLLLVVMPLTTNVTAQNVDQWTQAPLVAFLLPLIGFFMAPIYPVLNSVMLSSLPTQQHASMTGLIVVFSALGGTTGSIITGNVFQFLGGSVAFYFTLIPIAGLLFSLSVFRKKVELTAKGIEK